MQRSASVLAWLGFLVSVPAFLSYRVSFADFPVAHDFFSVGLFPLALAGILPGAKMRHAFGHSESYIRKIAGRHRVR